MTKLTIAVTLLSKSGKAARLTAIDIESKTCVINNGKEKLIIWSSAAEYKLDTGTEKSSTLTPKLLTALFNAESIHQEDNSTADTETVLEPDSGGQVDTQDAPEHLNTKRRRTPKVTLNDKEKQFLSLIPAQPDFNGVASELGARALIKKAQELHGIPIQNGRAVFLSLKNKGYYTAKGRESGLSLTVLQLTELGIQYLVENTLIIADNKEASV